VVQLSLPLEHLRDLHLDLHARDAGLDLDVVRDRVTLTAPARRL
jgi:hypothetical protein